jgi:hypothetical protein
MQPQALARGVRPAGRSPRGAAAVREVAAVERCVTVLQDRRTVLRVEVLPERPSWFESASGVASWAILDTLVADPAAT